MRQPMEDQMVTISRARFTIDFPANFVLIAAMNPCPCGYYNHPERECSCPTGTVERYLNKVSGPLLDRIDLHIEVTPVSYNELSDERSGEPSKLIRKRVNQAREIQRQRFSRGQSVNQKIRKSDDRIDQKSNADMTSKQIRQYCKLDPKSAEILKRAMEKFGFSARAYDRILKVARTIADLDGASDIGTRHIAEAVQYRSLDRKEWGG
jgi:magnesium chelatase family protein